MSAQKEKHKTTRRAKRPHRLIESFASNLARLRTERGLSKSDLAKRALADVSHIGRLERLGGIPSLDLVARLAEAMGVSTAELIAPDAERHESIEPLRKQIRGLLEHTLARATKPELHALAILIAAVGRIPS